MAAHKHYRRKWVEAGYDERMGSAWVCLPPSPGKIRLYHFTSAAHGMSDIENGWLKVARIADCNDPFELISLNFRAQPRRRSGRDFRKEIDTTTGFLSFSRNWIESLMWSHYAERHKGVCLGFDLPRNDLTEMQYNAERLLDGLDDVNDDPSNLTPKLQQALLRTKARGWQYELEMRRYLNLKDMRQVGDKFFCLFSKDLVLQEVILGDRCKLELPAVRRHVKKHQPQAIAYNARLAFGSFAIVPIEHTIP